MAALRCWEAIKAATTCIDFSSFHESTMHGLYVPVTFHPFAQAEWAKGVQLPEANAANLNKLHLIKDPKANGTR
ncbi:hypothetical protein [Paraburkholderia bannensis]|uniref:hypothetical protein n=1 Tax=Paraburkholderia bannensis TaxID=765414 RepID=UPI002AB68456|nr:hypothetical protein [Paraburkholderia bannensis]